MMGTDHLVPAAALDGHCDPSTLSFSTTASLLPVDAVFGQERAVRAIEFALGMRAAGYHLYAAGPDGLGKTAIVEAFLRQHAAQMPPPVEWAVVRNFSNADRPLVVPFPRGGARPFADQLAQSVRRAVDELHEAFQSDSYAKRRQTLAARAEEARERHFRGLQEAAAGLGFAVQFTPQGVMTVPTTDGQPMSPEQYAALPEARRHAIEQAGEQLEQVMADGLLAMRSLERDAAEQVHQLDEEVAASAVNHHIEPLLAACAALDPALARHVEAVRDDLVGSREQLMAEQPSQPWMPSAVQRQAAILRQYEINVLTDAVESDRAPVVVEPNPTYYNLIGRIEYVGQFGTMVTDHTMIKGGALVRANGGFLVLRARDLLLNPAAYNGLKRALTQRSLTIENISEAFGIVPTSGLRPEPIPLDVQVVIVGDRELQALLYRFDPDFRDLFRVRADFDSEFERDAENIAGLAHVIRVQSERAGLLHFRADAVAQLVEYSSRAAEDQRRLSANMGAFVDLLRQADFWARQEGAAEVGAAHIERTLEERVYRSSYIRDRLREAIADGTILVDTTGTVIGQVNALSVLDLGEVTVGQPSRITCVTYAGQGRLIATERETHLAGPIHDKGFLGAGGFLADRFGRERAMAVDARLTFEQMYGAIEGDSASSAELYALLSSLAEVPLRQSIAVTGSVDQRGEVQAIGGATAKIEGFYDVCHERGLDGTQGVIIPRANVPNVVLRSEVADAIATGRFHVWAVDRIEDGIEVLTGIPAGTRGADGRYSEESVFRKIEDRLASYAKDSTAQHTTAAQEVLVTAPVAPSPQPPGLPPAPPSPPPVRVD